MPRQTDLKAKTQKPLPAEENELEGKQDMGGKQGGQAGFPKPTKRPQLFFSRSWRLSISFKA